MLCKVTIGNVTQGFLKCYLQGFSVALFLVSTEIAAASKLLLPDKSRSVCSVGKLLSEGHLLL